MAAERLTVMVAGALKGLLQTMMLRFLETLDEF
jgi:hypothetical protein